MRSNPYFLKQSYRLPRQVLNRQIIEIICREMRRQKITFSCATAKELKEIAGIIKTIKEEGMPKYFICKNLGSDLGKGIFLHPDFKAIEKGRVIAPYAGQVAFVAQKTFHDGSYAFTPVENIYLDKQEQLLYDKEAIYRPLRLYALKIDACKEGNFTRFINHSDKPNVVAYTLSIPSNSHGVSAAPVEIIYFAKKTIHPGEQLLVSYEDGEKSYWKGHDAKPVPMSPRTFRVNNYNLNLIKNLLY